MKGEMNLKDTIAAISSPRGTGAIAIIRIDGEKSHEIAKKITGLQKVEYKKVYHRFIKYKNEILNFYYNQKLMDKYIENGYKRVKTKFSLEKMISSVEKVYFKTQKI